REACHPYEIVPVLQMRTLPLLNDSHFSFPVAYRLHPSTSQCIRRQNHQCDKVYRPYQKSIHYSPRDSSSKILKCSAVLKSFSFPQNKETGIGSINHYRSLWRTVSYSLFNYNYISCL